MSPQPAADALDRALAEIDRCQRRIGALCFILGLLGAYALTTWGIPRFEAAIAERPDPPRPFTFTCGPFCEVDVTPADEYQLRATCVCPGDR